MVARFTTTPAEFIEAVWALSSVIYGFGGLSQGQAVWRRVGLFLAAGILGYLIMALGDAIALRTDGFTMRDFMVAVIVALVTAFGVTVGMGQFQKWRMRKALARQPAEEDVEIVVDEKGLWWNTKTQKHFWLYSAFDHVIAFKDGYYLVSGLSGAYIPGRGFAADAEKLDFETLLKEKLPAAATAQFFAAKAF